MNIPLNQIIPFLKAGKIKIAIFGLGRIGLPTALAFAEKGVTIYGVDTQESVINSLKNLKTHIDEPGLPDLLKAVMKSNKFFVTTNYREVMKEADVIIICVPTPVTSDKIPDYSSIIEVCNNGLKFLKKDDLVIVESTISPGTIEHLMVPLIKKSAGLNAGIDYGIACCPERADPGTILVNFKKVPRIIGGYTKKSAEITTEIYRSITDADIIQVSNDKIACAVKLTENIFRDVNIALINELAILYEKIGLDTIEIIKAASTKWNFQPHYPGAGVGGPCLPANPYYLIQEAIKVGFVPHLIRVAREINDRMPQHIIELALQALNQAGKSVKTAKIAILGITYKPDVHDFQLSPAIPIIQALQQFGAKVVIYDPLIQSADTLNHNFLNGTTCANSVEEAITNADCIIIVTAHRQFSQLKIKDVEKLAAKPLTIVDGRNIFDLNELPSGIIYFGVGRKKLG